MLNEKNAINITQSEPENNIDQKITIREMLNQNKKPYTYLLWLNKDGNVMLVKDDENVETMKFIYSINDFKIFNKLEEKDYGIDVFCFKDNDDVYGILLKSELVVSRDIIDILVEGILQAMKQVESVPEDQKSQIVQSIEPLANILLVFIKTSKSQADIDKMFLYDETIEEDDIDIDGDEMELFEERDDDYDDEYIEVIDEDTV